MPSMKAVETDVPEVPAEEASFEPTGFTDGLAWEIHEFRGVRYKVTELSIGEYDEIVKKATRTEKRTSPITGNPEDVEMLDQQLQSRLMLKACVVEPSRIDVTKLGTRLIVTLNSIVNRLHYGDEPDAIAPKKKDGEDKDGSEDKPGNG